jgi:hypothetical protein
VQGVSSSTAVQGTATSRHNPMSQGSQWLQMECVMGKGPMEAGGILLRCRLPMKCGGSYQVRLIAGHLDCSQQCQSRAMRTLAGHFCPSACQHSDSTLALPRGHRPAGLLRTTQLL